jgi:hypothetical protein
LKIAKLESNLNFLLQQYFEEKMEIPENSYSSLNDLIRHRKTGLIFEISFSSFYYNNQNVELADRAYTQY